MSDSQDTLQILIDVRSRLDELSKTQEAFRKTREEAEGFGGALKTGLGIDLAHRGIEMLTSTVKELALESFQMAQQIRNGARNLEMSTSAYQVLGQVLREAGGDSDMLNMAVSRNNRSLIEARNTTSAAAGAYRTLHLDLATVSQMPVEKRFELIGRAVLDSTDKTAAFTAASQILGTRNLPTLLAALKQLAEEGYDKVSAAAEKSGHIMGDDTVARLAAATLAREEFHRKWVIFTGEEIAGAMQLGSAFARVLRDLPFAAAGAVLRPDQAGAFAGQLWRDFITQPGAKGGPAGEPGTSAHDIELKEQLADAEYKLAAAMEHRKTVENDPEITGIAKRDQKVQLDQKELALRLALNAAIKAQPPDGEDPHARELLIRKQDERIKQLEDQIAHAGKSDQFSDAAQATKDKFALFNNEGGGAAPDIGASMEMGAMDWVTGLGSASQQVASTMKSTLGATVTGIGDGIFNWITRTQSFGASMLSLGGTILHSVVNSLVQVGEQMLVNAVLRRMLDKEEAAAVKDSLGILALKAGFKSLSQLGPIYGTIAFIAALAGIMALTHGFESGGYTGGREGEVAGLVHGEEGVLNAPAMRRLGIERLNALNSGAPLDAISGSAQAAFGGNGAAALGSGSRDTARNIHLHLDRATFAQAMQEDSTAYFREIAAREMRS